MEVVVFVAVFALVGWYAYKQGWLDKWFAKAEAKYDEIKDDLKD